MTPASMTVFIPAYNEEATLEGVVADVRAALADAGRTDHEILIVDDASTDGTGVIADRISAADARVRAVHNERNRNLGYNFRLAARLAAKDCMVMIPGDGDIERESMAGIFRALGSADCVLVYAANPELRPSVRRAVSRSFTAVMNALFGFRIRYYNGPNGFRVPLLRRVRGTTDGFAFMAETVVSLLSAGSSYVEVPMRLKPSVAGEMATSAFRVKNVLSVAKTVVSLFLRARVRRGSLLQDGPAGA